MELGLDEPHADADHVAEPRLPRLWQVPDETGAPAVWIEADQRDLDHPSLDILADLVADFARDDAVGPAPVGRDYDAYIVQQQSELAARGEDRVLASWAEELAVAPRASGNALSPDDDDAWSEAESILTRLDLNRWELENLARRWRVTPFSLLLAAFRYAVWNVVGREPFIVCSGTRNRPVGYERTLGCFASAEVFCCTWDRGSSLQAEARRVQKEQGRARERAVLPMDYALERIGRSGCCQMKFTYRPEEGRSEAIWRLAPSSRKEARRDLSVEVVASDCLSVVASFRSARIAPEAIVPVLDAWADMISAEGAR